MTPTYAVLGLVSLIAALAASCRPSDAARRDRPGASAVAAGQIASMPHDSLSDRADAGRIQGDSAARVWIVEASDFQCPFCKDFHDVTYPQIVRDYVRTGKARLAYYNFPLAMHPHAEQAAEAAMCASVQDRFWQMHDSLFTSQPRWAERADATPVFDSLAAEVGVDTAAWRRCTESHAMRPLIDADRARSAANGVQATPSFFIGRTLPDKPTIAGAQPYAEFKAAIDRALASASAGAKGASH